jgi:hypothetical protein
LFIVQLTIGYYAQKVNLGPRTFGHAL